VLSGAMRGRRTARRPRCLRCASGFRRDRRRTRSSRARSASCSRRVADMCRGPMSVCVLQLSLRPPSTAT
jgi:hypothetical protein